MRRVVLLAFIWGWSFLFIKVAVAGMTPATVGGLRIALGAAALVVLCQLRGERLPRDRRSWRHFIVMGITYSAVPFTLLAWGEQRTTSALAAVCNATTPLFTASFAALALRERLRRPQQVGLVLGFAGVAVAAGLAGRDLARSSTAGAAAAVGAAACYGAAFIYARRHLGDVSPLAAATGQLVSATVIMAPFALGTSLASGLHLTPTRVAAIAVLGVVNTGLAYAVNYGNISLLGPTRASLVTYLVPVVAVTVGVLFLGEAFQLRLVLGGVVAVAGVALVQARLRGVGRLRAVPVVGSLLVALLVSGCGSSSARSDAGCVTTQEALDPLSSVHILPGAPEPAYRSDPPTSGAHRSLRDLPRGVVDTPIPRPIQVSLLEKGSVLVQYPSGATATAAALTSLASGNILVTVAPNPVVTQGVVATAWTWKLTCRALDTGAVRTFIAAHEGHGPGTP